MSKKPDTSDEAEQLELEELEAPEERSKRTDKKIEELYDETSARILQERLDFLLPNIVDLVSKDKWVNVHPEYQRRLRWDDNKKSLLIESLLMNIPIPPIFLFESELNRYEVMDGQQRLASIVEFYENRLPLKGLKFWPDLNGRTYDECPPRIRRGLDRRRLSAVVLLAESKKSKDDDRQDIRLQVFERLNTGGTTLNPQELRNCVFRGKFNDLVVKLAQQKQLNEMLGMPIYDENILSDGTLSEEIQDNYLFKTMGDCQIVLRFFAFRDAAKIRGSVRSILNDCMEFHLNDTDSEIETLKEIFVSRLKYVRKIFGKNAFRLPGKKPKLSRPLFDAIMVAMDRVYSKRKLLFENRLEIRRAFPSLFDDPTNYEIIVGKPNTADAIKQRIQIVERFLKTTAT